MTGFGIGVLYNIVIIWLKKIAGEMENSRTAFSCDILCYYMEEAEK